MTQAGIRWKTSGHATASACVFLAFLVLSTRTQAAESWIGGPECEESIDSHRIERKLQRSELDAIYETFGTYVADCDGGIYLVDLQHSQRMWRVNESWHVFDLESVSWLDDDYNDIVVIASYATGIGPTAGRLFRARIVMTRQGGGPVSGWAPGEPEILEYDDASPSPETEEPAGVDSPDPAVRDERSASGVITASTPEEFAALGIRDGNQPFALDVDYETSRFVMAPVWLTSGSAHIKHVRVGKSADGWTMSYEESMPPIGTADMKLSLIYAVLPKDGRPVQLSGVKRQGKLIKVASGVIDRGGFSGAPPP